MVYEWDLQRAKRASVIRAFVVLIAIAMTVALPAGLLFVALSI